MNKWNIEKVRNDFPILRREVRGKPLVYLDNAATTQRPQAVVDALSDFYLKSNANVHRGVHFLSQESTAMYEEVRNKVAQFIGIKNENEIIFTRGTTESINLVMQTWGRSEVKAGDAVLVTRMEHHSNFVPWQALAQEKNAEFRIVELDQDYNIDYHSLKNCLQGKPKILAITMMSNVLGTINPIAKIAAIAKEHGALVLVDAAQAVAHSSVAIKDLGPIDFFAFSSHKMCGPTGVGVLWARPELLKKIPPYQYGGDMIEDVGDKETKWNKIPWKFEAGTPNFADIIAFGAAIDYLEKLHLPSMHAYEEELLGYALDKMHSIPGLKIFGPASSNQRGAVISFAVDKIHPHDMATFLDVQGIAIRAGHHCAQPLMRTLQVPATSRASFYFYNTKAEVDYLVEKIMEAKKYFC